jgi:anti-sigma-K factor RskA
MGCEPTRELAAELALGIADGEERARALRHLAECAECRRAVEEYSAVTDELLMLAPAQQPPPGFESRVFERLAPARPRRRLRRILVPLAAAAAAAAVAAGAILGATSDDRRLADQYRSTLAAAHGSYFTAARLRDAAHAPGGLVYGYRGRSSWIYVGLYADHRSAR